MSWLARHRLDVVSQRTSTDVSGRQPVFASHSSAVDSRLEGVEDVAQGMKFAIAFQNTFNSQHVSMDTHDSLSQLASPLADLETRNSLRHVPLSHTHSLGACQIELEP